MKFEKKEYVEVEYSVWSAFKEDKNNLSIKIYCGNANSLRYFIPKQKKIQK